MCALIKFNRAVSPLYNQNIYAAAYVLYEDDSGRNRLENSSDYHGARKCRNNHARLCKRDQSASPEWDDANGGKDEAEVELCNSNPVWGHLVFLLPMIYLRKMRGISEMHLSVQTIRTCRKVFTKQRSIWKCFSEICFWTRRMSFIIAIYI